MQYMCKQVYLMRKRDKIKNNLDFKNKGDTNLGIPSTSSVRSAKLISVDSAWPLYDASAVAIPAKAISKTIETRRLSIT